MKIKCGVCGMTVVRLVEEGGNIAVWRCAKCGAFYLTFNDKAFQLPRIFKLTATKAKVYEETEHEQGDIAGREHQADSIREGNEDAR